VRDMIAVGWTRRHWKAAIVLLVVIFLWLVWPTPYTYRLVHPAQDLGNGRIGAFPLVGRAFTVRTNRLTGHVEYFDPRIGHWIGWPGQ
jgi:hypothetical protein